MSPLVWDLAHIGQQEELWLLRGGNPDRPGILTREVEKLYDAFVHSRASRVDLPLLSPAEARTYCRDRADKALDALDALPDDRRRRNFGFGLVVSHENQHDETMLQALNLRSRPAAARPRNVAAAGPGRARGHIGAGARAVPFVLGVDAVDEPYSLDNERPAHVVDVPAFRIGRVPVTNGEWRQFIDDGGYGQPRWWSQRGWEHREQAGLTRTAVLEPPTAPAPGSVTSRTSPPTNPFSTSRYFEAEAYAAWAGARLPTEVEWEKACAWDPAAGARRRYPWGASEPAAHLANLGGDALRPAPVGAYPAGASAYGVEQMLGDVWEWTSSPLRPWPGFTPMIYEQYSAAVLRRRLPGAARRVVGGGGGHPAAQLPQLGPPDPPADLLRVRLAWDSWAG